MNNQTVRIDIVPRLEDAALAQISDKLNKLSTNLQNYGKILITPELNGKAFMDVLEKFNKHFKALEVEIIPKIALDKIKEVSKAFDTQVKAVKEITDATEEWVVLQKKGVEIMSEKIPLLKYEQKAQFDSLQGLKDYADYLGIVVKDTKQLPANFEELDAKTQRLVVSTAGIESQFEKGAESLEKMQERAKNIALEIERLKLLASRYGMDDDIAEQLSAQKESYTHIINKIIEQENYLARTEGRLITQNQQLNEQLGLQEKIADLQIKIIDHSAAYVFTDEQREALRLRFDELKAEMSIVEVIKEKAEQYSKLNSLYDKLSKEAEGIRLVEGASEELEEIYSLINDVVNILKSLEQDGVNAGEAMKTIAEPIKEAKLSLEELRVKQEEFQKLVSSFEGDDIYGEGYAKAQKDLQEVTKLLYEYRKAERDKAKEQEALNKEQSIQQAEINEEYAKRAEFLTKAKELEKENQEATKEIVNDLQKQLDVFAKIDDYLQKEKIIKKEQNELTVEQQIKLEGILAKLDQANVRVAEYTREVNNAKTEVEELEKKGFGAAQLELANEHLNKMQANLRSANVDVQRLTIESKMAQTNMSAMAKFGDMIGKSFAKIGPALIIMKLLDNVIEKLMKELQVVVDTIFASLMPAIQPLLTLVQQLVVAFSPLLDSFVDVIRNVVEPLMPLLKKGTDFINRILKAIQPILTMVITIGAVVAGLVVMFNPLVAAISLIVVGMNSFSLFAKKSEDNLSKARIAQEGLLQQQEAGNRITQEELEGQKALVEHYNRRLQLSGRLTESEAKSRKDAEKIISRENNARVKALREQFSEGENITAGLKEQVERLEVLNQKKAAGVRLSFDEKEELKEILGLHKDIAEEASNQHQARHNLLKLRAEQSNLTASEISGMRNELKMLKSELKSVDFSGFTFTGKDAASIKERIKELEDLFDIIDGKKDKNKRVKDIKDYLSDITKLERENRKQLALLDAQMIDDASERSMAILRINQEFALEQFDAETKALDKSAKNYNELLAERAKARGVLEQQHNNARLKQIVDNSLAEYKAQVDAQKRIYEETKKYRELLLNNITTEDLANIKKFADTSKQMIEDTFIYETAALQRQLDEKLISQEYYTEMLKQLETKKNADIAKINAEARQRETNLQIQNITDRNQRLLAIEMQGINDKFDAEIAKYAGNSAIIERLERERQQALRKAQLDAVRANMSEVSKITLQGMRNTSKAIDQFYSAQRQGQRDLESMKEGHKLQEKELLASLNRREITQEEYHKRISELTVANAEAERQKREEMAQAMRESFVGLFDDMANQFKEASNQMMSDMIEMGAAGEDFSKKMSEAWATMAAASVATFASSLAEGKSFTKSMLLMAIDALAMIAQIQIAEATARALASAESVATFGLAGLAKAGVLTALIQAAVAVAKGAVNSMNFYEGGLVTKGSTQYDSVNAKLAKNEFVVNNKAVMKGNNLEFLEWLNKSNANIYDLLMQKPEHRKVFDLSDYNSTNKLNEIIANSRIYVNVDTKEMVNRLQSMEKEISTTNKKLDSLAGVIEHKDLIVNNKIFAKDIAVRREKINNFYS